MPEYSDDSDEELGAYIYRTSRTAQLLREAAASTKLTTKNNNNIRVRRSKGRVLVNLKMYLFHQNQRNAVRKRKGRNILFIFANTKDAPT